MSETINDSKVVMTEVKDTDEIQQDPATDTTEVDDKFKAGMAADVKFRKSFIYKAYRHLWYSPVSFIFTYTRKVASHCSGMLERLLLPW